VVLIVREAIGRLLHPTEVQGGAVLVVGIAGLIVNVVSAWYLHSQGGDSVNVRGAFLHLAADALGSVAAIGSAVVILWTGWTPIDPILSFLIGALIVYSTWPLLRETLDIMLQRAPEEIDIAELKSTILAPDEVTAILDMHVWQLDSSHLVLSAIVEAEKPLSLAEYNRRADQVRTALQEKFGIVHATLEWRDPEHPREGCDTEYDVSLYPEPEEKT
jgi:cobalt-zinc-cadmium efflux system protein